MSVNMACTTRADGCSLCSAIIYDTLIYPGNILRKVVSIPGSDCGGGSCCSEDLARRATATETYETLAPNTAASRLPLYLRSYHASCKLVALAIWCHLTTSNRINPYPTPTLYTVHYTVDPGVSLPTPKAPFDRAMSSLSIDDSRSTSSRRIYTDNLSHLF
jgi:hypothetical protein